MTSNFEYGQIFHTPFQIQCRQFVKDYHGYWYPPTIHTMFDYDILNCELPMEYLDIISRMNEIVNKISRYRCDLTAFDIRNRSDDFITYNEEYSHYQEYKIMGDWPPQFVNIARPNTMLEATALSKHYHDAKVGIKTLYWIQDPFSKKEYGLLLSKETYENFKFNEDIIYYPEQQYKHKSKKILEEYFNCSFDNRELNHMYSLKYGQSPDPYVLLDNSKLEPIEKFHELLIPDF